MVNAQEPLNPEIAVERSSPPTPPSPPPVHRRRASIDSRLILCRHPPPRRLADLRAFSTKTSMTTIAWGRVASSFGQWSVRTPFQHMRSLSASQHASFLPSTRLAMDHTSPKRHRHLPILVDFVVLTGLCIRPRGAVVFLFSHRSHLREHGPAGPAFLDCTAVLVNASWVV